MARDLIAGDKKDVMQICVRPWIKYFASSVGIIASLPSAMGCIYFALNPSKAIDQPLSVLFCVCLATFFGGMTYRWLTIRGEAGPQSIYLRGLLKTVDIQTSQLANVREVRLSSSTGDNSPSIYLIGHNDEVLGKVPGSLGLCPNWPTFFKHLIKLATTSRESRANRLPESIRDKPVDEWTSQDFERYEREN
ncbi:MAG TPA: hypothetical protein PKD64_16930 [Pirellulaceae bacterium]|nr:hypothetical protein [Pirellulaceae bacterium]HMO93873.1 hypothetical protein [Pirellulaceae bacterium]HMP67713.1 hypothetical protein [Pirellulaceae bacterium]